VSNGLVVFSLDFERVERLWSCRAPAVAERILERVGHTAEDEDEEDPEEFPEGEDRPPTIREALQQFIMGEALRKDFPRPYSWALLAICHYAGTLLPTDALGGADWPHVELVDKRTIDHGRRPPLGPHSR
jgi:hypothetical protein